MRIHSTMAFSEAHTEYRAAKAGYSSCADTDEPDAWRRLDAASGQFFNADAVTPFEINAKIEAAHDRARDDFSISSFYTIEALRADLGRLQRDAVSPAFADEWAAYRKVAERIETEGFDAPSGVLELTLGQMSDNLYVEIALKPCTSTGDFILKRYLAMLTDSGACDAPSDREDGSANPWDIDISKPPAARFDHADMLGAYQDIDDTDLGANLLAYGRVEFDAEAWLEAADRVGQRVDLIQQHDGSWSFGTSYVYPEEERANASGQPAKDVPERIRRERRRLQRLLAFPGGENRYRLVADEMRREWPQLVHANPRAPKPVDEPVEVEQAA